MQKWPSTRKAFGYLRVSTAVQAREGESLSVQRELLEAICRLEGFELVDVFVEEAVSASRPLAKRPIGKKLLATCEAGDTIVALRLDRLFRDTSDALAMLGTFTRRNVRLYLRDLGGFVTGDSVGQLLFTLMSSVAAFERNRTRERILEVRASMRRQKRFLGGTTPFGQRLETREGKSYLEPDRALLDQVAALRAQGYSTRLIAGHFAQNGVHVSHHAVARLLRREAI